MPTVAIAGVSGYGRAHLQAIGALEALGRLQLVAGCDPALRDDDRARLGGLAITTDFAEMLRDHPSDIVVIATPPHTHFDLARQAATAGIAMLLEKPAVVSMVQHRALSALLDQHHVPCQVGFQTLEGPDTRRLVELAMRGDVGEVVGVSVSGRWVRTDAYYRRAPWSGQRRLDERIVADGVVTNPFAHAVMNGMAVIAAAHPHATPVALTAEAYRCSEIETDDTASLRITYDNGVWLTIAATLRAETPAPNETVVHGRLGRAVANADSTVVVTGDGGEPPRTSEALLMNLIENVRTDGETPLLVPLSRTEPFTRFVDGMMRTVPVPVASRFLDVQEAPIWPGDEFRPGETRPDRRITLRGVDDAVVRSGSQGLLFSELGVPWSVAPTEVSLRSET